MQEMLYVKMVLTLLGSFFRRDTLSWEDTLRLASFLGEQLHNLHLLPFPSLNASAFPYSEEEINYPCGNGSVTDNLSIPTEWDFFIRTLTRRKKDVSSRLTKWYASFYH